MITTTCQRGFTLFELSIALVVIGLLIGAGFSGASSLFQETQRLREKSRIETLNKSLLQYAYTHAGFPSPTTSHNIAATTLGDSTMSVYGNAYRYYVPNSLITTTTGGNITSFCNAIKLLATNNSAVSDVPKICSTNNTTSTCTTAIPVASLLVSTGKNNQFETINDTTDIIFANPSKSMEAGYDDIVVAISFNDLAYRCAARL